GEEELARCKDGALLANAGHFGYEIDKDSLARMAIERQKARDGVEGYILEDGRTLYLLGEGELVNLALGDGHPVEIMDISFALQALSLEYLVRNAAGLSPQVISVPEEIDEHVARMVLASL
ncbi:MAG TPA: adenosylhomocysteinase, partial [Candidatus Acetothermia bacterium]|nr:adenosylhomocysteinase [Candidatus Acetothermia bacterium]HEX32259.1 adenosylhomocysteinase [Candidatus Acetothermia bacterium]